MKMKKLFAMIMALTMLLFSNTQIFAKNHHARATGATINETITRWQLLNIFPPLLIL